MKKVLIILCLSLFMLFAFYGCGGNNMVDNAETMASDLLDPTDDTDNNGNVSDNNGLIGDEDSTDKNTEASSSSTDNKSKARTATQNSDNNTNSTTNSTGAPMV